MFRTTEMCKIRMISKFNIGINFSKVKSVRIDTLFNKIHLKMGKKVFVSEIKKKYKMNILCTCNGEKLV